MSLRKLPEVGRGRTNLVLAVLFFGVFVLGCAELLVVGMLDLIAADLHVSTSAAGTLVTAYALGLAIGGPIMTALTIKLDRRVVLVGALVVFALANLAPVLITDYGLFVVARGVDGAVQGLFVAVAFGIGTSIVSPERAGRAISVIISGVAVSAALGVPLGTAIGQRLGWRGSFTAIIRDQHRRRFGPGRRWCGDQQLQRLGPGDDRSHHCRDRHRGRLGHQLPQAAGGRGGYGADHSDRAGRQGRMTQPRNTTSRPETGRAVAPRRRPRFDPGLGRWAGHRPSPWPWQRLGSARTTAMSSRMK